MLKSKWIRGVVIGAAGLMIPVLAAAKTSTLIRHRSATKSLSTTSVVKHSGKLSRRLSTSSKRLSTVRRHSRVKLTHSGKKLHTLRVKHSSLSSAHVKRHALSSHAILPPKTM
jgi:hypothetical protein